MWMRIRAAGRKQGAMRRLGFDGSAAVCRIGMRAAWRLGLGCESTACSTLGESCVAIRIWAAVRRKQGAVRGSDMTAAACLIGIRAAGRFGLGRGCACTTVVMKAACGLGLRLHRARRTACGLGLSPARRLGLRAGYSCAPIRIRIGLCITCASRSASDLHVD